MNPEYLEVLNGLQRHHALFGEFWSVGSLTESDQLPTAAIVFDEHGDGFNFVINPKFWASLDMNEKAFVISHECLHVYFDHGLRGMSLKNKKAANVAADLVVNHYLVDVFDFKRKDLKMTHLGGVDKLCWRDTVFPDDVIVEPNRSMEYYYELLMKGAQDAPEGVGTLDDHDSLNGQGKGGNAQQAADQAAEIVEQVTGRLSDDELQDFEDKAKEGNAGEEAAGKLAGNFAGKMVKIIRLGKVKKKKKWETVIEEVLGRFKGKDKDITIEQWAHPNRRTHGMRGDLMLPTEIDEVMPVRERIDVWFFQDTSGSCVSYAERFFRAAATIPEDRFRIRMFCFDTQVYETSLKTGKLYGFGGTWFQPMEDEIQKIMKNEKIKYPQAVFVITDGYGSQINPQHSDRWHWFLTDENNAWGNQKQFVPSKSRSYSLKDFE